MEKNIITLEELNEPDIDKIYIEVYVPDKQDVEKEKLKLDLDFSKIKW